MLHRVKGHRAYKLRERGGDEMAHASAAALQCKDRYLALCFRLVFGEDRTPCRLSGVQEITLIARDDRCQDGDRLGADLNAGFRVGHEVVVPVRMSRRPALRAKDDQAVTV